jgi:branched-chain amino acid transport system substrate-binding protein
VAIAQKFVSDPRIVIELGDFSSAASMAASPIYQRGKLVQFGFTNSHPDFTKTGDYMWSDAPNHCRRDADARRFRDRQARAEAAAVLFINGDWGRTSKDLFIHAAAKRWVRRLSGPRAICRTRRISGRPWCALRDANPDGLILISYYPDGALAAQQIRALGLKQPVVAASSVLFAEVPGTGRGGGGRDLHHHQFLRRRSAAGGAGFRAEVQARSMARSPAVMPRGRMTRWWWRRP